MRLETLGDLEAQFGGGALAGFESGVFFYKVELCGARSSQTETHFLEIV
jgi:hypothetical protein